MYKRKMQIGYDRKLNKPIFEELTYEYFIKHIDNEFTFKYKGMTVDFAVHFEENKKVYEVNLNGHEKEATHEYFSSAEELITNARIDGKSIKCIWNDLEN